MKAQFANKSFFNSRKELVKSSDAYKSILEKA